MAHHTNPRLHFAATVLPVFSGILAGLSTLNRLTGLLGQVVKRIARIAFFPLALLWFGIAWVAALAFSFLVSDQDLEGY